MQVNNQNRTGIIAASTVAGIGAGVAAGNYMPLVNAKSQATSDRFVKEVVKEMNSDKLYKLLNAASAKDYLDTVYATDKTYANNAQTEKFFNRFGDFLEIKREQMVDDKGNALKGKGLRDKLKEVVENKIAENGEVKFSEDGKQILLNSNTTEAEAKALVKDGFNKKKLVKAGTTITQDGHAVLERAMKTIKNERMIIGGLVAGAVALAASAVATCRPE